MRLINVHTFKLEEFHDCTQVKYAILSHRWGEQEVLYKDMVQADGDTVDLRSMDGFYKIERSCKEAVDRGYDYMWVDTCCIDKSSSAELQEAINSMFRWYASAEICFAFLSDVQWENDEDTFDRSRWFERGWTLQELLAPRHLAFYDAAWKRIESRKTMASRISSVTGIPDRFLTISFNPNMKLKSRPCIAMIMSWASNRKTTRPEDRAYTLLGLFDVNMPMLYGEGEKAFYRLQVELLQQSEDQSIFAWDGCERISKGLLANSPDNYRPTKMTKLLSESHGFDRRLSSQVSSEGIHLQVRLVPIYLNTYMALFNLKLGRQDIGIYVYRIHENRFARITSPFRCSESGLAHWPRNSNVSQLRTITVVRRLDDYELLRMRIFRHGVHDDDQFKHDTIKLRCLEKGGWADWLNNKEVEPLGMHGDPAFSKFHTWTFDEENLTIELKGSVLFALVRNHPSKSLHFGCFVVGFDFDSNFMCFISMSADKQYCYHNFQHLLNLPDEDFGFRESTDRDRIKVKSCRGGRYHVIQNETVAFKLQKQRGGFAVEPMLIRVQINTGTMFQLAITRESTKKCWSVFIDPENSPSFVDKIEHWTRLYI